MTALIRMDVPLDSGHATTDVRNGTMGTRGAGAAKMLLVGVVPEAFKPYDGIFRAYAEFGVEAAIAAKGGWSAVKVIRQAYLVLHTRSTTGQTGADRGYFDTGSEAKVSIRRLLTDAHYGSQGDGIIDPNLPLNDPVAQSTWDDDDASGIQSDEWASAHWDEFVSPNHRGETRIRCNALVGGWAPSSAGGHPIYYYDPTHGATLQRCGDPAHVDDTHVGYANHGVLIRTPSEADSAGEQRAEFFSGRMGADDSMKPKLVIVFEPYNPVPVTPTPIGPKGSAAKADFDFDGVIPQPSGDDPIASVEIQVNSDSAGGGTALWTPAVFPASAAWPDGQCSIPNPRQPTIPSGVEHSWRLRSKSKGGTQSGWSGWVNFTVPSNSPTVSPIAAGAREQVLGTPLSTRLTIAAAVERVYGVECQVATRLPSDDPMWRSPIWSSVDEPPYEIIFDVDPDAEPAVQSEGSGATVTPITVPWPFYQEQTTPGQGDCAPSMIGTAIHWASDGTINPGIPAEGKDYYHRDTTALKNQRIAWIRKMRTAGGVPASQAGFYQHEVFKAYHSLNDELTAHHRTHPAPVLYEGEAGSWKHVADALFDATKAVLLEVDYAPLDWYPSTSINGMTCTGYTSSGDPGGIGIVSDYPKFHEVSGQWCFRGNHQVFVYRRYSKNGVAWVDYADPLADGRGDSASSRGHPVAKHVQSVPLSVMAAAARKNYGTGRCKAVVITKTKSTDTPPPPPPPPPPSGTERTGTYSTTYEGPQLPPGDYSVRWRMWDDLGVTSKWGYDHSLVVTEGDPDAHPEPDHSIHTTASTAKVRVVIHDMKQPTHAEDAVQKPNPAAGNTAEYSRGPGAITAIITDPQHVGMSAYATTPGEVFFSLRINHPQIAECIPYRRHYELQEQRVDGSWRMVSEGLIHDIDVTAEDVVVYGWDYIGLLALSVESARQPDGADDAVIGGSPAGSKYVEKDIDYIINSQLTRAIADVDSPVGWIEVGTVEPMPEATTIYSAFVQRLTFIRGLIDSYQAGSGRRARVRARRDPADGNKLKFDVLEDSGTDRPQYRLEYGSLVQGFELIPFGDFAVKVMGIGHRALNVKPLYSSRSVDSMDTQVWGNIAKTAMWTDLADESDLTRRVLEAAAGQARIGKNVAIGIRVRGLDPLDGWDITDAIPIAIKRGPVDTRFWSPDQTGDAAESWWVIWGMEWRVEPDGHDELVLVVRPRIDDSVPLNETDHPLISTPPYAMPGASSDDWLVPVAPPPPGEEDMLLGVDTAFPYQPSLPIAKLKAEGAAFSIVKLTQGTYFSYSGASTRINETKTNGLIAGAYHFLTYIEKLDGSAEAPWNTGDKQCDYFIAHLPNQSPEGLLVAIDCEWNNGEDVTGPDGKSYPAHSWPHEKQVRDFVRRWFERFPTHPLLVYSNHANFGGSPNLDVKALNPLCYAWTVHIPGQPHAQYGNQIDTSKIIGWSAGWGGFAASLIVQWGAYGIHGLSFKVDGDAFRGTRAELLTYTVSKSEPPYDHASYVQGYNALLDRAKTTVGTISLSGNTAYNDGVTTAKDDLSDRIDTMHLTS